jgi:hypothetical protein
LLNDALNEPVTITENGRRKITKREAVRNNSRRRRAQPTRGARPSLPAEGPGGGVSRPGCRAMRASMRGPTLSWS